MKKLAALAVLYCATALMFALSALFGAAIALADSGACYTVADADARTYCLARARRDASMCYSIQRADTRALCLAEVRK